MRRGVSFADLQGAADAIVSSSVQEGFGYQFITPLVEHKPLIARRLEVLEDMESLYRRWPHAFYRTVQVPSASPSLSGPQALLRFRYTERIDRLAPTLGDQAVEELHRAVNTLLSGETIDFSFLLPHMQYTYLKDLRNNTAFRADVRSLNADLIKRITGALAAPTYDPVSDVESRFGLSTYAGNVARVVEATDRRGGPREDTAGQTVPPGPQNTPQDYLLHAFATLDYQRLLYE